MAPVSILSDSECTRPACSCGHSGAAHQAWPGCSSGDACGECACARYEAPDRWTLELPLAPPPARELCGDRECEDPPACRRDRRLAELAAPRRCACGHDRLSHRPDECRGLRSGAACACRAFTAAVAVLAVLGLAACSPRPCERPAGAWCLEGAPVPAAFAAEVSSAAAATVGPLGASGGTLEVFSAPFPCAGLPACSGAAWDPRHVAVVYAPELGLGPAVGSTALEHELCHAAGYWNDADANACAARALAAIGGAP